MIRIYEHNSAEYMQELTLRNKILRKPLGVSLYEEDLSQDEKDVHVGVFSGSRLVGCLLLSKINNDTVKMRQVAVDDSEQGKGIGARMVGFAEEWAVKNGYKVMTMHARKRAVGFYKKRGYMIVSDEFTEVGIPHYTMVKTLK